MSDTAAARPDSGDLAVQASALVVAIAWRNLWRNRRRTWLSAGAIAFATALLMFARSMQVGGYEAMIDSGTGLLTGHLQVQHREFLDDPQFEHLLRDADTIANTLHAHRLSVAATPRVSAFALLSVGEKSFGAQVLGVVPERESLVSRLPAMVTEGRYLGGGPEVVIGHSLARNLGARLGDELVVLGTGREGAMAALAVSVVGIFDSGFAELDRSVVQIPIDVVRAGFLLDEEGHQVAVRLERLSDMETLLVELEATLPGEVVAHRWQRLMPEIEQGIAMDRISARFMYTILALVVLFSIVNTFIMTVFERTHEFGMLAAIGMRRWRIIAMVQLEALWLSVLGTLLGLLFSVPILGWVVFVGIPLGEMTEAMQGLHVPDRMYGAFDLSVLASVPLLFLIGCQIAAFIPLQRLRALQPSEAMRAGT